MSSWRRRNLLAPRVSVFLNGIRPRWLAPCILCCPFPLLTVSPSRPQSLRVTVNLLVAIFGYHIGRIANRCDARARSGVASSGFFRFIYIFFFVSSLLGRLSETSTLRVTGGLRREAVR